MKCDQCGADNPPESTHCGSCGASLANVYSDSNWLGATCGAVLLIIFIPVGLCGLVFTIVSFQPGQYLLSGPNPFAYLALAIGALFIFIAYLVMRRK